MKYWEQNVFVLVCACLVFPLNAFCGPKFPAEIGTVGSAAVSGGNEVKAMEDAIADAVSNAFAFYLSEGIGTEVMKDNFQRIKTNFLPMAGELVENFLILSEFRDEDRLSVFLRVKFNRKLLEDLLRDSGIRSETDRQRQILVMTAEGRNGRYSFWWRNPDARSTLNPVELAVRKAFERRGFAHVDQGAVGAGEITPPMRDRELDDHRLADWGRLYGADFILYGSSDLDEQGELGLWLKAVKTDDGTPLAETRQSGSVEGSISDTRNLTPVLDTVAAGAAAALVPVMAGSEASEGGRLQVVSVVLEGAGALADSPLLERHMEENISGVTQVRPARLGRSRVAFEVTYRGNPRLLAEGLTGEGAPFRMKSTFDGSDTIHVERSGFSGLSDGLFRPEERIPH